MKLHIRTFAIFMLLLITGSITNKAWATKVTYHILTLPILDPSTPGSYDYHMRSELYNKRLEAVKVVVDNQTSLELPAQYKSPLATGFTYYKASDVTKSGSAVQIYQDNTKIKGYYYTINGDADDDDEGTTLSGSTAEYYVVYTYNASNTVAQLNGSVRYNIRTKYKDKGTWKDKGFFAYNRGRNNRPAVLPTAKVDPEMLASEDFMKVDVTGTNVSPYWKDNSGNNKNQEADVGSQFYFMFKFEGLDPYNIIIRTAYAKDSTYIEKNDGTLNFVYKWYKEGSMFTVSNNNNFYIASDEHRLYKTAYDPAIANPINPDSDEKLGNFHGQTGVVWNSFALLNNTDNSGYVFMGTRTVDGNGATQNSLYYLIEKDKCNNLTFNAGNSTDNLSIEGLYPIETVTFKVATPFYDPESPTEHIVSVEDQVSKYTVDNDPIETKYLPAALKRKYCTFNGKFYKDARCREEDEITHFTQATQDPTEGYQVYVGYDVSPAAPKFLPPSDSYTTATWYELTDDGSVQESGRKIRNNSGTYKNNGANGTYEKESEFAFEGDPYELKVLYRKGTEDASSKTYVTLNTYDTWDMPSDETVGSFLLRKYKGTGFWNWDAGHVSAAVSYGSDLTITPNTDKNAQTITINISGLNGSKYYKITTGGTDASQIVSVTPSTNNVRKVTGTTMTVVVKLAENTSGADQTMTVTFQEYDDAEGNTTFGSSSNITITQGTTPSSFAGNVVDYSSTNSTRVKVLELPTRTFTYNIVDMSGRIAVKASASQTIFSKLSLASIPSIIVSPFILDETVEFYDTYTDGDGRATLAGHKIPETPNTAANIFVTYTTAELDKKPINLSEDQEFNVVLNGQYLWYDSSDNSIKTTEKPELADLKDKKYLWKLRNRDPYAMLIDNMGAREEPGVAEDVTIYDDNGGTTTESRQKGGWVDLASIANGGALTFTTTRADAQPFVAKASVQSGVYEVMVATGAGTDASTTYYNIGRPADNTVKIYYNDIENGGYVHGNDVLKFHLEQSTPYTYYLIDKAKHKLLTLTSQNPDLALPAEYQSPLVGTYKYYAENNISVDNKETPSTSDDEYTPIDASATLKTLSDLEVACTDPTASTSEEWGGKVAPYQKTAKDEADMLSQVRLLETAGAYVFKIGETEPYTYQKVNVTRGYRGRAIYVTYDANDIVKFNSGQYMLKFLEPFAEGYFLEDGNDKLTSTKIKAVYPYCNGDGNLNIYGDEMQKEQFNGGASTRPRWIWYFVSENSDPYHVAIRSRSTISYNNINNYTYLTTYVVHFNQDNDENTKHVVTGGTLPGVASTNPMEYMVLGSQGNYKLLTTEEIDDGTTTERRKVISFEQYWKTYNMLKLHVLGINKNTDAYSDDETTWVVPKTDDPKTGDVNESNYRTTIEGRGWHSYNAYANATRWNGYNDKTEGHEKKVVENIEHWFQTFNMGNGTFDIESAEVPPVLVLLDLHGWEIMRLPLPTVNYPEGNDELAALRAYDSPMVKEYKFYSQATKASGCHKYSLRLDKGKERDQIKVNGEHYTSTSLGDLPPITATGVKSGSAFNDQFVTYTVKEEYAKSYDYTFTDNKDGTYSETGTASKFLVLLASRFLRYIEGASNPSYFSKPIYEASNPVGGNVYDAILDPQRVTQSNVSTAVDVSPQDGLIDDINLWYVQPNLNIDKEMGIKYAEVAGNTGEPWTEFETKKYYYDNGKAGFDPYNIQIKNVANSKFVSSHQTSASLHDGILIGDYSGGTTDMTLEDGFSYVGVNPMVATGSEGYDHTNMKISNQTFMAVSDANGNLQLMPRFDHKKRVNLVNNAGDSFTTLQESESLAKASASDNASMGTQTVFFVRPQIFEYKIIDNDGNESLRYKRGGDYYPAITEHFKSPLAKDFTYYTGFAEYESPAESTVEAWGAETGDLKRTATTAALMNSQINLLPTAGTYEYRVGTRGAFTYYTVVVTKGLQEKQITGSFAEAGLGEEDCNVIVRYDYDANADHDGDRILEGKWFTVKLANKDLQSSETRVVTTVGPTQGTGVYLYADDTVSPTKPGTIDEDDKIWQWKFRTAPADPSSDYYEAPDPYAIHLFNRYANYTTNPSEQPSPMAVGIKVPNANNGADRFALLPHSEGGYALAVAGTGAYTYQFVNGASMDTDDAATTVTETDFTQKAGIFDGVGSQLIVNDDVEHHFEYKVINNGGSDYVVDNPGYLAVSARQDNEMADAHGFFPYLPEAAQTPLLRMKDYKYYGFARPDPSDDTYAVIPQTLLYTLYGLYDDVVWVRYGAYDMDSTEFKIPNEKAIVSSHVARGERSHDVSMNIKGELPYNIIWYNDNMMKSSDDSNISYTGSHDLDGTTDYVWYFTGDDPYGLKIEHKKTGYYVYSSDGTTCSLDDASYTPFMLLKKDGYDYGILQVTGTMGSDAQRLTGFGGALTANASTDPTKFIIFGLSVHDLIYRLIIAKTCTKEEEEKDKAGTAADPSKYVDIPYRATESGTLTDLRIYGSTQRNLTAGTPAGATYQLGSTIAWGGENHTYSHNAGSVSIGDILEVPNAFNRPNCTYEFYIQDIYGSDKSTVETALNNKYKGLKLKNLMSDSELIDKTVIVNIVYSFDQTVATNTGLDFVRSIDDKCWYTYETQSGGTPYLAHYTNAWGLQTMEGRETRYSNDYLWTPVGDVYGFQLYNRYMIKNSDGSDKVMTFAGTVEENKNLAVAKPGSTVDAKTYTSGNEIFELLPGDNPNSGYFRVHPVVNTKEQTQYYVKRDAADNNYAKLSTTPSDWAFGLDMSLMEPYYERAGYVGGLTAAGKTAYETAVSTGTIMDIQRVVFDDDNIINFTTGYYRLHNQPGVSRINPVRYASGYLHKTELDYDNNSSVDADDDGDNLDAIPMHFYSKKGVTSSFSELSSGYTNTHATRGEIPIAPTERDPSTIFYIEGSVTGNKTISTATMSTQGLNVLGNKMTEGNGTTFTFIDIGGATLLITDKLDPQTRQYFNFDQTSNIYDLKFAHECPTDDAKWCLQPVQKGATAGNGEMPLEIATNQGGDGHYYATFYAPFDVLLPTDVPADDEEGTPAKNYYAYFCKTWDNAGLHPTAVPATNTYTEGKFVPAGTPVIIRTTDESNIVTLAIPSTSPTASSITTDLKGTYLEQLLSLDSSHDTYTLGLPFTSAASIDRETGIVTAPLKESATTGVGFYINATPNKEHDALQSMWQRNNRYVLHNKVYYRGSGSGAREMTLSGVDFVPVIFDGKENGEGKEPFEDASGRHEFVGDGCIYDLQGRRVATEQQVLDGTWRQRVSRGIYVINGKKVSIK